MKIIKSLHFVLLLLISSSLLIGCNVKPVINKKDVLKEENTISQEEKDKEDFSVDIASKIIEEFSKSGDLKIGEEVLNEFMNNEEYHIATKTQLLNYFIPQFNKLINDIKPFFETNYIEITKILTNENIDNVTGINEDIQSFFNEVERVHGKIYSNTEVGYLLTLDWQYFIDTYEDNIDPYFVEILQYYKDNIEISYRSSDRIINYDILTKKILNGEKLLDKRENDLYVDNVTKLLESYYKVFFGNYETTLFDNANHLNLETLKIFYDVLDKYPDSRLSDIISNYLSILKDEQGNYVKNTFATVYLMENIGGNIEYYQYDENGNYIEPNFN